MEVTKIWQAFLSPVWQPNESFCFTPNSLIEKAQDHRPSIPNPWPLTMKRTRWLVAALSLVLFSANTAQAETLSEAVQNATQTLAQGQIAQNPDKKIIVQVVNRASQKSDDLSKRVETELYKTLSKAFPEFELISLSEAQSGVNLG